MFYLEKITTCRFQLEDFQFVLDSSSDFLMHFLESAKKALADRECFFMKLENIKESCIIIADSTNTVINYKGKSYSYLIPAKAIIKQGFSSILQNKQNFLHFQSCCSLDRKAIQEYEKKVEQLLQELKNNIG